jgi:pimeloyl-ACP methyl ester carboxylesterase
VSTTHDIQYFTRGSGHRSAWRGSVGKGPTLVWLGGLHSDMDGTKAVALHQWAEQRGQGFLRFDYRGHGLSDVAFEDCTIDMWRDDALEVLDQLTEGPLVLVGSSMGGWMALLATKARQERVVGLCLIAPAPDFTEVLMWQTFPPEVRHEIETTGSWLRPSAYDDGGYRITKALIDSGRRNLVLDAPMSFDGPVRILQGQADPDVPWQGSVSLAAQLTSTDVHLTLIKDGDHRLSRPADIALLCNTVGRLLGAIP